MNPEFGRTRGGYYHRLPQKKNPFNKVETWRKPWVAKNHVYKGVKIFA